jgi:hypothetical protein
MPVEQSGSHGTSTSGMVRLHILPSLWKGGKSLPISGGEMIE